MMINPNQRLLNETQLPPSLADTHVALVTNFDRNHESVGFSINSYDHGERIDKEFLMHDYRDDFPTTEEYNIMTESEKSSKNRAPPEKKISHTYQEAKELPKTESAPSSFIKNSRQS